MNELKEKTEILEEAQKTLTALYNNGTLPRSEEEANFLRAFRELNIVNKIGIASRIEGMLEAQMYAQVSEK